MSLSRYADARTPKYHWIWASVADRAAGDLRIPVATLESFPSGRQFKWRYTPPNAVRHG